MHALRPRASVRPTLPQRYHSARLLGRNRKYRDDAFGTRVDRRGEDCCYDSRVPTHHEVGATGSYSWRRARANVIHPTVLVARGLGETETKERSNIRADGCRAPTCDTRDVSSTTCGTATCATTVECEPQPIHISPTEETSHPILDTTTFDAIIRFRRPSDCQSSASAASVRFSNNTLVPRGTRRRQR